MNRHERRASGLIVPPGSVKARGMVHKLVADTAKGMAGAAYEELAKFNDWYARWPDQDAFVARRWHSFIGAAKETLAEMLGMPDSQVTPDQKAEIHDALLKNAAVNPAINHLDSEMAKFRKKPVVIEAWPFDGSYASAQPILSLDASITYHGNGYCTIKTLEGVMRADAGDWIIKGVKGELYPCKPDIFAATYEEVS